MRELPFDNRFVTELPGDPEDGPRVRQVRGALWSRVLPTAVSAPRLVAWSRECAALVGLDEHDAAADWFAEVFGGNSLLPGMAPYAANYGGHQFGNWAGQLGDGRAITLGEVVNPQGERWELQLKGAGLTPYSRGADGRAVLRSSIREFLCSEAMHHLGVPTTRALSLVTTGDQVIRDMFYDGHPRAEHGAIVCRVAPSFIRLGNFELPARRGELDLLEKLVDFTIARDFPELAARDGTPLQRRAAWFAEVCARTARLMAHWMRVGFVHGVMNTDNLSILGLTIDYGPYGWVDDYDPDWTPNTTDAQGRRYRFGNQPPIAQWNLWQLANALFPVFGDAAPLEEALRGFVQQFEAADRANQAAKLGLAEHRGAEDQALTDELLRLMQANEVDMTILFRSLADLDPAAPSLAPLEQAFYHPGRRARAEPDFQAWLERYAARLATDPLPARDRLAHMNAANPRYVLRNYLAQQAIDRAEQGDHGGVLELLEVMRHPYAEQPGRERFAERRPDWARDRAGCSMLSCSSLSTEATATAEPLPQIAPPARAALLAMALIAVGNFANFYVYDSLAPLAAILSSELGFSDTQIGTLGAIYSLPNMVLLLFGGMLVDRFGIGRIACLTAGICLLGAVLTAASPSFTVMALGRLLFGIGGETYNLCTLAAVTAWYPRRHTAFAMGATMAMGRLGSVAVDLSPTWAAPAYAAGWQPPLVLAAGLALLGFAATAWYWGLEHRAAIVPSAATKAGTVRPRIAWRELLRFDRRYWYLVALCVLWYAAILAFRGTFAIKYLQQAHGYTLDHAGQVVSNMFLAAIVATPLIGWLSDRSGRQGLLLAIGAALLPLAFVVLQYAPQLAWLGTVLIGLSYSVVPSVMYPYAARLVERARFGTALGLMWVFQNAGVAGANVAAGAFNDAWGASADNPGGYEPMMLFFLVLTTLGFLFALLLWRRTR